MTARPKWFMVGVALVALLIAAVGAVLVVRQVQADHQTKRCDPLLVVEVTAGDETAFQRTFLGREGEPFSEVDGQSLLDRADLSPDGTELVALVPTNGRFDRNGDPAAELWVLDLNGIRLRRLADSSQRAHGPRWSPDGRTVLFTQNHPGEHPVIAVVPSNGNGEARVVTTSGRLWNPTWSPDGSTIAYLTDAAPFSKQISVAAITSDGVTRELVTEDQPFASEIGYSPDGSALLINRIHDEPLGVSVLDVATGAEVHIVDAASTWAPQWTSDGNYLYWAQGNEVLTGGSQDNHLVDQRPVDVPDINMGNGYISNLDLGPC